jgi:hypothetical protein
MEAFQQALIPSNFSPNHQSFGSNLGGQKEANINSLTSESSETRNYQKPIAK